MVLLYCCVKKRKGGFHGEWNNKDYAAPTCIFPHTISAKIGAPAFGLHREIDNTSCLTAEDKKGKKIDA